MSFTPTETSNLPIILAECQKQGLTLPKFKEDIAYILATARHETANFATLTEYASGQAYEGRADLGNTQKGDGVRFKGRGYVQITGRNNYTKFSQILGKDLVSNPDLVLEPSTAAFILVYGMKNGSFTGRKLEDFAYKVVENREINFLEARRIVNGMDQSKLIADYANQYLARINNNEFNQLFTQNNQNMPKIIYPTEQTWQKLLEATNQEHLDYLKNGLNENEINLNLFVSDYADRVNEKKEAQKSPVKDTNQIKNLLNQILSLI